MSASRDDVVQSDRSTCGRHSRECNLQDLLVLFPQHQLCLPAAVRENDRIQVATEIKPNHNENIHFVLLTRFIFVSAGREQNVNKQKFNISELWNWSVWKKHKSIIDTPPPHQEFLDPWPPPTPLEFPIPSVGEVWIFSGTTHYLICMFSFYSVLWEVLWSRLLHCP